MPIDLKKVERAAHLFESFSSEVVHRTAEQEGISLQEVIAGGELYEALRRERLIERGVKGDPAYGGGHWR